MSRPAPSRPGPPWPDLAWKIADRADWDRALAVGAFAGSPIDRADGFIHLSAEDQLAGTAARHFAGRGDLVLVAVDLIRLGEAVRWEPSRGGAFFPHLYADLPVSAVTETRALSVTADGRMTPGDPE